MYRYLSKLPAQLHIDLGNSSMHTSWGETVVQIISELSNLVSENKRLGMFG